MIFIQALMWNVGTCHPDDKGEIRTRGPRKEKSTNAGYRGGVARSSDEVAERSRSKGAASFSRCYWSTYSGRNQ